MNVTNRQGTGSIGSGPPLGSLDGSGQLDGLTMTQGTAQPRKTFKSQVKEFFRDVKQFFKSLTQRKATVGQPPAIKTGKAGKASAPSEPMLGKGLGEVDFAKAKSFKPLSSGNGGACLVKLEDSTVVIKGGGGGSCREVYGSKLARELGLPAPETRFLTREEQGEIQGQMARQGVSMPKRTGGGEEPVIVMEYVKGTTVCDARDERTAKSTDVAKSFGTWIAFAAFIKEPDTFHGLISQREYTSGGGINSSNFLIDPRNPDAGIVGIDQNVGTGDASDAIHDIGSGSDSFFMRAGQHVSEACKDRADPEDLMASVKEGAHEVFAEIAKMSPERIVELGRESGMDDKGIQDLLDRQELIREQVG